MSNAGKGVMLDVQETVDRVYATAHDHGWWDDAVPNFPEKLALIHSEVSEALEAYRNGNRIDEIHVLSTGKPDGIPVELADVIIRIFDLCGYYKIPIVEAMVLKMAYNDSRSYRHGSKKC